MDAVERDQFFPGLNDILVLTSDYKPDYGLYDVQNKVVVLVVDIQTFSQGW